MTKFLLGVAVGYVFHNAIDKIVNKAAYSIDHPGRSTDDEPVT